MSFSFVYPYPMPSTKGWGPGWPNCQNDRIVAHPIFQGGVNRRIVKLVDRLVAELQKEGYQFRSGWSWGFACRSTKTSSGSQTETPSVHSWGLALDFNAPINVFGADKDKTELGQAKYAYVHRLMREYGFFWLGPSIGDWMHFHFAGSPADADRMLAQAINNNLGETTTYVVAGTRFRSLKKALGRVRDLLKKGKDALVRVLR